MCGGRGLSLLHQCFLILSFHPPPGLSSNVVPMYLGELSPKNLRGALGVVPQLFITVGILTAQILGLRNLLANEKGKPGHLRATALPPLCGRVFCKLGFSLCSAACPSGPHAALASEVLVTDWLTCSSPVGPG